MKIVKGKIKPNRRLKAWEIILLAVGSPVWATLLIAAVVVILSLYISLWSVMVSFWAVFVSLIAVSLCSVAMGIGFSVGGKVSAGLAMLGAGCVCAGLAILLYLGCKAATDGTLLLTKKLVWGMKKGFVKREEA